MIIRVEQGKGGKDRNAMLSQSLLDLLRTWWKAARPQGWLFPGRDPAQPMTTRQLNRACHAAASRVAFARLAGSARTQSTSSSAALKSP
jgi:integrase/recombinase XerD